MVEFSRRMPNPRIHSRRPNRLSAAFSALGIGLILATLAGNLRAQTPAPTQSAPQAPPAAASASAPAPSATGPSATAAAVPESSAAPAAAAAPGAQAAVASPHGALVGSAPPQPVMQLMTGDPLESDTHRQQAELARSERQFQPENLSRAEPGMRVGSIGVLVRDAQGLPLSGRKVVLKRLKESIAEGNKSDELSTTSNAEGHAGFLDQSTNTDFQYEVVTNEGPAQYSSGPFRLDRQNGQLVVLNVFPITADINQTFIASRTLYVVEPRDDVFQIQALYRFHNTNPITWVPEDLRIKLPVGAKAFRPANQSGDLHLIEEDGSVRIKGSFAPGEHEVSFSFHLDNPGEPTARLQLPLPPHTMDAKIYVESSLDMGLVSPNLDAATEARGKQGQRALMALRDFLRFDGVRPTELTATITGLPTRGSGPLVASLIALAIVGVGVYSTSRVRRVGSIAAADRAQARELLMTELVAVEKAFRQQQIGPKTYEQTRRSLLDALVRIEAT